MEAIPDYDDSPWTEEELHALAWEAGLSIGWEAMDEYDDFAETPSLSGGLPSRCRRQAEPGGGKEET